MTKHFLTPESEIQKYIQILLSPATRGVVERVFQIANPSLYPISQEFPLYICFVDRETVTLEYVEEMLSPIVRNEYDLSLGRRVRTGSLIQFYKPIGFYNKYLELTLVNDAYNQVEKLKDIGLMTGVSQAKRLSLTDNGMIGALSMETALNAKKMKDFKIVSNDMDIELWMTHDNEYIQSYLDDKYGNPNVLCAYKKIKGDEDDLDLCPAIEYKTQYDNLYHKRLLTVYNPVQ
jgi:hypothetical protein